MLFYALGYAEDPVKALICGALFMQTRIVFVSIRILRKISMYPCNLLTLAVRGGCNDLARESFYKGNLNIIAFPKK